MVSVYGGHMGNYFEPLATLHYTSSCTKIGGLGGFPVGHVLLPLLRR